jgi:hypothetical protein
VQEIIIGKVRGFLFPIAGDSEKVEVVLAAINLVGCISSFNFDIDNFSELLRERELQRMRHRPLRQWELQRTRHRQRILR